MEKLRRISQLAVLFSSVPVYDGGLIDGFGRCGGLCHLDFYMWASEETGVQVDLVQARLYELFRRLDSQESLTRTLQATQKQQNHSDNLTTMLGGMEMINGLAKAGGKAGTSGRMRLGATPSQRTIPRLCQRGMETQSSLMTEFDVFMYKRGSDPGDHCFLTPRLISGLIGRAREHLRMAGGLCRFA